MIVNLPPENAIKTKKPVYEKSRSGVDATDRMEVMVEIPPESTVKTKEPIVDKPESILDATDHLKMVVDMHLENRAKSKKPKKSPDSPVGNSSSVGETTVVSELLCYIQNLLSC